MINILTVRNRNINLDSAIEIAFRKHKIKIAESISNPNVLHGMFNEEQLEYIAREMTNQNIPTRTGHPIYLHINELTYYVKSLSDILICKQSDILFNHIANLGSSSNALTLFYNNYMSPLETTLKDDPRLMLLKQLCYYTLSESPVITLLKIFKSMDSHTKEHIDNDTENIFFVKLMFTHLNLPQLTPELAKSYVNFIDKHGSVVADYFLKLVFYASQQGIRPNSIFFLGGNCKTYWTQLLISLGYSKFYQEFPSLWETKDDKKVLRDLAKDYFHNKYKLSIFRGLNVRDLMDKSCEIRTLFNMLEFVEAQSFEDKVVIAGAVIIDRYLTQHNCKVNLPELKYLLKSAPLIFQKFEIITFFCRLNNQLTVNKISELIKRNEINYILKTIHGSNVDVQIPPQLAEVLLLSEAL